MAQTMRRLAGVSALALLAAGALTPTQAVACTATPTLDVSGETTTVTSFEVTCGPEQSSAPFATSADEYFREGGDSSEIFVEQYDGSGNDTVTIEGGTVEAGSDLQPPLIDESFEEGRLNEPQTPNSIEMLDGDDTFIITSGQVGTASAPLTVDLGEGDNRFTASGGLLYGGVTAGEGANTFTLSDDAFISGDISAGNGGNDFAMSGGEVGSVSFGTGADEVEISGGTVGGAVDLNDGDDRFEMTGGRILGSVFGQGGDDSFNVSGGTIEQSIFAGSGNDRVFISGSANIVGSTADPDAIGLEAGDDFFQMTGGTIGAGASESVGVSGGAGNDTLLFQGGSLEGFVAGNDGSDIIRLSGTASISQHITAGEGADEITVTGGTVGTFINGEAGNDEVSIEGGTVGGDIFGSDGDDQVTIAGGAVNGAITGDGGTDMVTVSGGSVGGGIDAETVHLFGGTIGGDITGLTGNTLVINDGQSSTPLVFSDGVLFSGDNAVGTITDTDLAQASNGSFRSQNFSGFSSLSLFNSTIGFSSSPQIIDLLNLSDGSTLYSSGNIVLQSQSGGLGNLTINDSSINMVNGSIGDTLQVGDLTLNNALFAVDVNQGASQADQIILGGVLNVSGTNTIAVNLVDTPTFGVSEIPFLIGGGDAAGDFVVTGIPGTLASLFNYEVLASPSGDLILLASPGDLSPLMGAKAMIDSQPVLTALDAINDITNTAIEYGLDLSGHRVTQVSPTFGIFASGQWARVSHDGFTVTSNGVTGVGPSFTADDFSAAFSLDWNAAKSFDIEDRYGLNIGVFGGYTSTSVDLDSFLGFPTIGNADNESTMFGVYTLFRKGFNYALVSATAFLGETDIVNSVLGSTGNYDTAGYAGTASIGRMFVLSDTARFDLRGGLVGVTFTGDEFTDSKGNSYGKSRVSFGAVKFEPGIFSVHAFDNGMILSPYLRGEIQMRFGYRNTGSIEGIEFEFDDSDFSTALSAGANLKITESATVSAELRGKASTDVTTIAGKVGLKVAF